MQSVTRNEAAVSVPHDAGTIGRLPDFSALLSIGSHWFDQGCCSAVGVELCLGKVRSEREGGGIMAGQWGEEFWYGMLGRFVGYYKAKPEDR